ncbi:exonuclease/endonuclease/phosphatase family protein [Breznakiellaceae bacterium SP9]
MGYIIGSFNLHNFSSRHVSKDVKTIASIITGERFDIIALQEVLDPSAFRKILQHLPPYWDGSYASPRSRKQELILVKDKFGKPAVKKSSSDASKGYAFLWNKKRFIECSENGPQIVERMKGSLIRSPYYARFIPNSSFGGSFFELRLVNIHLCSPYENKRKHLKEYNTALKSIFTSINKARYGDNRPAYTVMLGDYGMPLKWCSDIRIENQIILTDQTQETFISDKQSLPKNIAFDSTMSTFDSIMSEVEKVVQESTPANSPVWVATALVATGAHIVKDVKKMLDANKGEGERLRESFDHFSYDAARFTDVILRMEPVNAVEKYYSGDFEGYKNRVSNHVPILMEVTLNDDFI